MPRLERTVRANQKGFVTVDAGLKSLYRHGGVPEVIGSDYPGIEYDWFGDEYGKLTSPDNARLPSIGTVLELTTSHCDPTINLFDRFATYNGSNPFRTPATMMVIPHLEHNIGAYFPKGGMHQVATSLVALAEKLGVTFHYGSKVEEVTLSGSRSAVRRTRLAVSGLRISNGELPTGFSHIITDLDIYFVYKKLLPKITFPEKWFSEDVYGATQPMQAP